MVYLSQKRVESSLIYLHATPPNSYPDLRDTIRYRYRAYKFAFGFGDLSRAFSLNDQSHMFSSCSRDSPFAANPLLRGTLGLAAFKFAHSQICWNFRHYLFAEPMTQLAD